MTDLTIDLCSLPQAVTQSHKRYQVLRRDYLYGWQLVDFLHSRLLEANQVITVSCLESSTCSVVVVRVEQQDHGNLLQCRMHPEYASTAALVEKTSSPLLKTICRACICQSNANSLTVCKKPTATGNTKQSPLRSLYSLNHTIFSGPLRCTPHDRYQVGTLWVGSPHQCPNSMSPQTVYPRVVRP